MVKRKLTLYVDSELIETAKKMGINLSQLMERCLAREINKVELKIEGEKLAKMAEDFRKEIDELLLQMPEIALIPEEAKKELADRYAVPVSTVERHLNLRAVYFLSKKYGIRLDTISNKLIDKDRRDALLHLIYIVVTAPVLLDIPPMQIKNTAKKIFRIDNDELALKLGWNIASFVRRYRDFFAKKLVEEKWITEEDLRSMRIFIQSEEN